MVIISILLQVEPEKQRELMQTMKAIANLTVQEKGCVCQRFFKDVYQEDVYTLQEEWITREELHRHLASDHFSALMGAIKLLGHLLDVKLITVSTIEGIEEIGGIRRQSQADADAAFQDSYDGYPLHMQEEGKIFVTDFGLEATVKGKKYHSAPHDRGLIFNIQKFSLHDGSGIRTLVFFKGCPLHCAWCSNPEGQSQLQELAYNANKCIGYDPCGWCIDACERKAIRKNDNGKIHVDRSLCNHCGQCVEVCPAKALTVFGRHMSVAEILDVVQEDASFYARSGGGLTLGGGDPTMQPAFAANLLKTARERGIDTAIETAGYCSWDRLKSICLHTDTVFFDIKSLNAAKHKQATGVDNTQILKNFKRLCTAFPDKRIVVRTPVIPGFNDTDEDIQSIADFLTNASVRTDYELLPYHAFGQSKYVQLGKAYPLDPTQGLTDDRFDHLKQIAARKTGESIDPK